MSLAITRIIAAAGTVVIAAAVNVTTGMLTQHWTLAWWMATVALVVVGAAAQVWLTLADQSRHRDARESPAARSVTVGGDVSGIVSTGDRSINVQSR